MATSAHHTDIPWCVIDDISILYHATISSNTAVSYDERTVFGSHGAYAVWTGTAPRSVSLSTSLVGANGDEVEFNLLQVENAYKWTQESPPTCRYIELPTTMTTEWDMDVRIESFDASIPDGTHFDSDWDDPIQIELSLGMKECKAI